MTLDLYSELKKIWANITTEENVTDFNFDIREYKKLLDILQVGDYYYLITNVRQSRFDLVGPEVQKMLGYTVEEFDLPLYSSLVHPDDLPCILNFEAAVERFFAALSGEQLFKYKIQYDQRMRHADGHYLRVLSQYVIIQHDVENVRTFVVQTDITHLKKEPKPVLSFIGLDGEPSYVNVDVQNIFRPAREIFTNREKDILRALAKGMNSAEISKALNISKLTVDSHRKNMLKKTGAKSTNEIIGIAFNKGWI